MTSAAVNPTMRSHGWNIELLTAPGDVPFAGVFQPAKDVFMTFRDIVNEMRLSFEFQDESSDVWNEVAFGLLDMLNVSEDECPAPKFVHGNGLDQLVPALPELEPDAPEDRAILQYRVFKHHDCGLSADQPSKCHFEARCAQRISKPVRRLEPRYLPPKKASTDPRYAAYPLRKTVRGRKPGSPSKRSASGSVSPRKDPDIDQADEDFANMVAPPECNISDERAKMTMANFRNSCLTSAKQCAVTGMGRSWCDSPTIGPALQACHIVSQLQYHTYPDPEADADEMQDGGERVSPRRLEQAWERTWASENGVLLFSHLHDMFDQRLFSIHPETLQVRAFMPYDILLAYHGRKAKVQRRVDRAALRHHYDMCCIENMAAKMPFVEQLPRTGSVASTSGINTPLEIRPTLAGIASPRILESPSEQNQGQDGQRPDGDPSKRARQSERQHIPELTSDCTDSSRSPSDKPMGDSTASPDLPWSRKRKREHEPRIAANHESYLTPYNSEGFLADVSWELTRLARRRKWGRGYSFA
ncbi:HNHc domain-containing protein [Fusarium falciforme]|uniref:HNHc domain-containing protein n=1 Tax=Fusarium falciforme TaxID=195108 RepID=UPI002300BE55|nr:HNHc domain-containing protein [Fusarium falciforme]WAO97091.1 HNHc domain-containing protein [Fusarium falciforme]